MKKSTIFGLVLAAMLSNVSVMSMSKTNKSRSNTPDQYSRHQFRTHRPRSHSRSKDSKEAGYKCCSRRKYSTPDSHYHKSNRRRKTPHNRTNHKTHNIHRRHRYNHQHTPSGVEMDHWANVRNECGDVIGRVGAGENVTVLGIDCDEPDRVMVYDSNSGVYGSVLASCVYGGYVWDGNCDSGAYTSSQGYCSGSYNGSYSNEGYCSGSYSESYDNCYIDQGYYDGGYVNDCSSYGYQETCSGGYYDNCYIDTYGNDCSGNCYSDSYYYDTYGDSSYYNCSAYQDSCNWDCGYICDYASSCSYTVRYIEIVQIVEVYEPMVRSCFGRGTMMGCNV